MKSIYLITSILLSLTLSQQVIAQTDKSIYCPNADLVKYKVVGEKHAVDYVLYATNKEGKYFESTVLQGTIVDPVSLYNTQYDSTTRTLSCIYLAFSSQDKRFPTLINKGDY